MSFRQEDNVVVADTPPVDAGYLSACKRKLAEFAAENDIPTPFAAEWAERDGIVSFTSTHDGRVFGIGAPKAN